MIAVEEEIRSRYRELVMKWDGLSAQPGKANKVFKTHHAFYKQIRSTPEGQAALRSLLADTEPAVRLLAAVHLLPTSPKETEPVLEELQTTSRLHSVSAKYSLAGYRAGTLDLDW